MPGVNPHRRLAWGQELEPWRSDGGLWEVREAATDLDSTRAGDVTSVTAGKQAQRFSRRAHGLSPLEQLAAGRSRARSGAVFLVACKAQHHIHQTRDTFEGADLVLVDFVSSQVEQQP